MLLRLNRIEYWLGRRNPEVLGKDGVDAIAGRGEKLLASLVLNSPQSQQEEASSRDISVEGWVDGVGEGRGDEENLTLYLRFSEGADEDRNWLTRGLQDLSPYGNRILIVDPINFSIEATTSSVDEGEEGKVKILCDLVFSPMNGLTQNYDNFIYAEVLRGGSLDTGIWHSNQHESRQRGSLEFWFYCPPGLVYDEIILARRSACPRGETVQSIIHAPKERHLLWELALKSSGSFEFRTLSNAISCPVKPHNDEDSSTSDSEHSESSRVSYQGWNHMCVTFNCKNQPESQCQVSLIVKGFLMVSSSLLISLPDLNDRNSSNADYVLKRTYLQFGIGACNGFRMTEIRHWACDRSAEDTRMMMYEYLTPAEIRRKLHVKIRQKNSRLISSASNQLAPPRSSKVSDVTQLSVENLDVLDNTMPRSEVSDVSHLCTNECSIDSRTQSNHMNETMAIATDIGSEKSSDNRGAHIYRVYDLTNFMKPKIAAAILKGPSATNHFGGCSGGLSSCHSLHRFVVSSTQQMLKLSPH
jgi:hypothetical protein